jgi:ABC-2 type transport system permease protein
MSIKYSLIIAIQVVQSFFSSRNIITLFAFFNFFLFLILWVGEQQRQNYQKVTDHYSQEIRQRWEANPDKHPHRMAHYGYVAFKNPFALSFFDFGLDAYTGKSIFLEAHKPIPYGILSCCRLYLAP